MERSTRTGSGTLGKDLPKDGSKVSLEPQEIVALLVDDRRAALGVRDRPVVLRHCLPEDHRLSTIRIEIDRSASVWSLDGAVYVALKGRGVFGSPKWQPVNPSAAISWRASSWVPRYMPPSVGSLHHFASDLTA
jgi:hypothetical protein